MRTTRRTQVDAHPDDGAFALEKFFKHLLYLLFNNYPREALELVPIEDRRGRDLDAVNDGGPPRYRSCPASSRC